MKMVSSEYQLKIRYNEVDRMGYLYHGNYAALYHIGRTELLRRSGFPDIDLEKHGYLLAVRKMEVDYLKPITYDETITVRTRLISLSRVKMEFNFEILNTAGVLVNRAECQVVVIDCKERKPVRLDKQIFTAIKTNMSTASL